MMDLQNISNADVHQDILIAPRRTGIKIYCCHTLCNKGQKPIPGQNGLILIYRASGIHTLRGRQYVPAHHQPDHQTHQPLTLQGLL